MKTYICILRGINVSGKNIIKMDALKHSFEKLGFQKVSTYIQSGNIVFQYQDEKPETLAERIRNQVQKDFLLNVPVQVFSLEEFKKIVEANPFTGNSLKNISFMHITILAATPENVDISAIESRKADGEEIFIHNDVVYLYCPHGYGRTKLNNNFLERKMKVSATTRNWKTTMKLLKIAKNIQQ